MFSAIHELENNIQPTSYILDNTIASLSNGANENLTLCDIKIICNQSKKVSQYSKFLIL